MGGIGMRNHKLFIGLLAVGLAATATQAAEPVLNYEVTGDELILTYSGTLLQSTDAVNWAEVASASSPYKVKISDKKLFFCAKDGSESKNITIPLSDTVNLDMIWVEPGTFMMGSPSDELGRDEGEIQHEVTLTKGYWLGKYEVTQAQYKAVMGKNPSYFWLGDDWPVEQVSRNEAMEFCAKLTAIEKAAGRLPWGYEYSLPTEAQWEYACRAGTTTALNSGKNLSDMYVCPEMDEVGWYDDNNYGMTSMVGQKLPNAWGFYDMHGNVFEWCLDWYNSDYYENSPESDPVDLRESNICVRRGGSYARYSAICRSADRAAFGSGGGKDKETGFRVALVSKDMSVPLSKDVDLRMIWIEPGTFTMGSPSDELGRKEEETQHEVTLTQGYWLGKYEVTQAQYEAVMGTNPSYWEGANLPVDSIIWDDAMEFCAKLTEIERGAGRLPEGYEYTLPTEAQWEYVCRAGTTTALNSGKNLSDEYKCPEMDEVGWYYYNGTRKTHPVGQKLPNAWGLYDMHGNVSEWCLDWYGDYPTTAVTDPTGPVTGEDRVIRSGACDYAYHCRSAHRSNGAPSHFSGTYRGFRVALVPVQ